MRYARAATIAVVTIFVAAAASASSYTVTNANDSGPGSLRDVITQANGSPGDKTIRFAIGNGPATLKPATPYPTTLGHIDILGDSQPGYTSKPLIEIDASLLSAPAFHITSDSSLGNVVIHGDHAAAIEASDSAMIDLCFIGTDLSGTTAIPNATGILVTGGGVHISSNLISGNAIGIEVTSTAADAKLYLNRIGQSASGTFAIPNGVGVDVSGNGTAAGLDIGLSTLPNIISGNSGPAIRVTSFNSVAITDNYIGTTGWDGKPLGNGSGIELNGSNATITGNVIENNGGAAIWIGGGSGNRISQNAIIRNGFGIDLGTTRDGHTANDGLDGDSGPNGLQNHPIITMVIANPTSPTPTTTITGSLSSAANSTYSIELFANTNCAGGDYATAETYLTTLSVTTDSSGNATFSYLGSYLPLSNGVAATATDAQNNTSEISNCSVVTTHGAFKLPTIPSSVLETAGSITVTVSRVVGSAGTATVDYATSTPDPEPGFFTATPGLDYAATSGTLTFADGEVSKTVTIPIFDDKLWETNEIFNLTLSNPTGGATLDYISSNRVYIIDDEPESKIAIADTSVIEGNSGTTYARFPVTITPPAGFPVTITFATAGWTATAGEDFQPISGSITFAPGEAMKTIDVPVFGDTKYEMDEIFGVSLLSATPAQFVTFANYAAQGTIVNDDVGKVSCTPSAASVLEGAAGTIKNVEITCTPDSSLTGGVYYVTVEGTAKATKQDYMFSSGSIVFNPGSGAAKFSIPIIGNDLIEPDKQFTIKLTADPVPPSNFTVEPAAITVTIINDDTPGVVTCQDVSVTEGNSGVRNASIFCVSPTRVTGTIDYATHDGTAVAPGDYLAASGTLTFNNEMTATFSVPIFGDQVIEPDEKFTIALTAHPSALAPFTLARDSIVVTILNDDQPPPAQVVLLSPARLIATGGETAPVSATIEPPSDTATPITIIALDPSIVDVPGSAVIAPNQPAVIPFVAKKRGSTVVTVSAGDSVAAAVLIVDVADGAPSLASVEPSAGIVPGGANVSLHGANLSAGCVASFGGIPATNAIFNNATTATVVAPPHGAGTVDVTLTCGSSTATLPHAFTYVSTRGRAARH